MGVREYAIIGSLYRARTAGMTGRFSKLFRNLPWRSPGLQPGLRCGLMHLERQRMSRGAENSVGALVIGRHGEVATHYSFGEHTMVPDVFW